MLRKVDRRSCDRAGNCIGGRDGVICGKPEVVAVSGGEVEEMQTLCYALFLVEIV